MKIPHLTDYIFSDIDCLEFISTDEVIRIEMDVVKDALALTNQKIKLINENVEELFGLLGMRNLSAFMGELFVSSMVNVSDGLLRKNPHQDGYPDLLVMSEAGKTLWTSLATNLREKKPFSWFESGGIEVKATCGSVPTPAEAMKRGLTKPDMGEARISVIKGYDWKAHHQLTNSLIGLVWDFFDGVPAIVALFYSANLSPEDWGNIVQPKAGGGRNTSVSIMSRKGVAKMYEGWVAVINDERYIKFFNKFNKADLIAGRR